MRRFWIALLMTTTLLVALVPSALAIEYRQGRTTTVAANETVDDDLVVSGDSVTIDGTVNGDVFAAVNTIIVNGTINGSLFAAGRVVDINGTVSGTAAAAAERVLVQGRVERSLLAAGRTVTLAQGGSVGRAFSAPAIAWSSMVRLSGAWQWAPRTCSSRGRSAGMCGPPPLRWT